MNKYLYTVNGRDLNDAFELKSSWAYSDKFVPARHIENAARDYHDNHDGWEDSWPLNIELFKEDGTSLGVFEVEREYDPVFYARLKK